MSITAILNFFQPAPYLPELSDPVRVKKQYRYWRLRIFYSMYFGYLFYYFTRKSFTFITPFLMTDLGLTKADIGWIASTLSLSYGVSKFTSGILCDRSNPRYFMSVGLILTGVANIFFGYFSSLWVLCLFWGLNGWFQGWGWPACTKQLTHWFSHSERGTWWGIASTSYALGGFLISRLAANVAGAYGWRFAVFVPGVICIVVGFWLLNRLRDVPQSLGLPPIEKYKNAKQAQRAANSNSEWAAKAAETTTTEKTAAENAANSAAANANTNEAAIPIKQVLFEHVLPNKFVWILGFSYFFIYILRTAVEGFGAIYLREMKDYSPVEAAACVGWFEVGGFLGILIAGLGSDHLFKGRRIPMTVLSTIGLIFSLAGLWYFTPGNFFQGSCVVGLFGFFVFIPQVLVGLAAAELVSKKASAASNGFASCLAHIGAAVAGYPFGKLTDMLGWSWFFAALAGSATITLMILVPLWSMKRNEKEEFLELALDLESESQASSKGGVSRPGRLQGAQS